jgi:hypothetical protein
MSGSDGERGGGKGIEMGIGIGRSEGNRTVMKTNVSKGLGRTLVIE